MAEKNFIDVTGNREYKSDACIALLSKVMRRPSLCEANQDAMAISRHAYGVSGICIKCV